MEPQPDNPISNFQRSTIDQIMDNRAGVTKRREELIEERKEYAAALNRLASSKDGQYVISKIIEFCGVLSDDNTPPDGRLAVEKGRRQVYLRAIRPFLDKTLRMEIENQ